MASFPVDDRSVRRCGSPRSLRDAHPRQRGDAALGKGKLGVPKRGRALAVFSSDIGTGRLRTLPGRPVRSGGRFAINDYGYLIGLPVEFAGGCSGRTGTTGTADGHVACLSPQRTHDALDHPSQFERTRLVGPVVLTQTDSTTWVPPGWDVEVDKLGNLRLERAR